MDNLSPHEKACLDYAIAQASTQLQTALLDTCADQEYRLCLLELGIN